MFAALKKKTSLYSLHWNFIYCYSFIFPKEVFKPGSKTWILLEVTKLQLLLSACLLCLILEAGCRENPGWPQTHYIAEDSFELVISLLSPLSVEVTEVGHHSGLCTGGLQHARQAPYRFNRNPSPWPCSEKIPYQTDCSLCLFSFEGHGLGQVSQTAIPENLAALLDALNFIQKFAYAIG